MNLDVRGLVSLVTRDIKKYIQNTLYKYAKKDDVNELKADLAQYKEDVNAEFGNYLNVKTTVLELDNMVNLETLKTATGLENGAESTASKFAIYSTSAYEYAKPLTTYSVWRYSGISGFSLLNGFACYDKDKNYLGQSTTVSSNAYKTLANTYYVRICGSTANLSASRQPSINEGETFTSYKPYKDEWVTITTEYAKKTDLNEYAKKTDIVDKYIPTPIIVSGNIASGGNLTIPYTSVSDTKQNHTICFTGRITSIEKLRIVHSVASYRSGILEIDKTNNKVRVYDATTVKNEYDLNLTLDAFISIIITVKRNQKADIAITDNSNCKTFSNVDWYGCRDGIIAESVGSVLTDCELSFVCNDIANDIWGFGDSYFDMWVNIVNDYGYTNWMVDGCSGRTSAGALSSFNKLIALKTPRRIMWCMGMNDADSDTAINANWKTTFDTVKEYCVTNNVELIGFTVPNVPDRNHTFKNAYVKANCTRVVDVNHAVGADLNTSWYSGLLSSDNVHPASLGRKVIANEVIKCVPELFRMM